MRRISNYLDIIVMSDITDVMSIVDSLAISVEILIIGGVGALWRNSLLK